MNNPTPIKIPKVQSEYQYTPVRILIKDSNNKELVLRQQTIQGVTIPKGSLIPLIDILEPIQHNHYGDTVYVPTTYVNRLLKYLFFEKIRGK